MTDRKTGLQITFPLEFKHTLKFVNGDNQTCFLNFDLSIEPFNGPYQEYCGSQIYINLHESGYDINLEGYNQPYKAVQRDNGSNLYIIGKEETKTRTCFDFAMDGIACEGSVDIDPAVYRRYETAIMGMLKSLTVIKNPTSVISTLPPSGDMDMESRSNGRQYLLARQFGMAFEIPQGFEHVLTYSGCKDFAILSIDLTKPPFNEPYDFNGLDKNLKSRIDICLYRGMKGKYPDEGDFIIYQRGGSGPDIVIINKLETDQFVNFDFEIPDSCCGGSVSVSRPFYEKYENSIFGLLHTILIENLQP